MSTGDFCGGEGRKKGEKKEEKKERRKEEKKKDSSFQHSSSTTFNILSSDTKLLFLFIWIRGRHVAGGGYKQMLMST